MSLLVVGLSYRTAGLALLERSALTRPACRALEVRLCGSAHIAEAVVLSTCNRLEVYTDVSKFHGGVADVGEWLAEATGVALSELTDHLYVHYEEAAVAHLFHLVCGLDSMAVGEQQIIGQVRSAMRAAQDQGCVGRSLSAVLQHALRLGKRAHAETGLDRAGHSLVEAGLDRAEVVVGPLADARVLVIGAGAMSGLAVAAAARAGAGELVVTNRTPERAARLAAGVGGRAAPIEAMAEVLADADVVISCTGAVGHVIDLTAARGASSARAGRPQVYVDLALPRDVDPRVGELAGVSVIDLEALGRMLAGEQMSADLAQVRELVEQEVAGFLAVQRAEAVAPTVVALRALARSVMEAELARLAGRLGDVDERVRIEVEQTVHRVVEKLLHTPTVRVKQRAGEPGGGAYAEVLRELFDLDLETISAVSSVGVLAPVGAVDSTTAMNATAMTGTTMTTTGPVPGPAPGGTS
jgi:glutamyl-tRNA reductase